MDILNKLGIKDENSGGCYGPGNWISSSDAGQTESFNPSTKKLIASVGKGKALNAAKYQKNICKSNGIFLKTST